MNEDKEHNARPLQIQIGPNQHHAKVWKPHEPVLSISFDDGAALCVAVVGRR